MRSQPDMARSNEGGLLDSELAAEHGGTMRDLATARKVAHVLRFISPSYYIPGKQEWGVF